MGKKGLVAYFNISVYWVIYGYYGMLVSLWVKGGLVACFNISVYWIIYGYCGILVSLWIKRAWWLASTYLSTGQSMDIVEYWLVYG